MAYKMGQFLAVVMFFVIGYQRARWFRRRYGRTGWDWPPVVWGLVCAFSFPVGILLLTISERSGRARTTAPPSLWPDQDVPWPNQATSRRSQAMPRPNQDTPYGHAGVPGSDPPPAAEDQPPQGGWRPTALPPS